MKKLKETIMTWLPAIFLAILTFLTCSSQLLYSFDKIISDRLYQVPTPTSKLIKIIAIDEKTIEKYGDMKTWSRDIPAALVEKLMEEKEASPALIAFDIMYVGQVTEEGDKRFAEACEKAGNVVTAVNMVIKPRVSLDGAGKAVIDRNHVEMVEYPYEQLRQASSYGFANTLQDSDGYIRFSKTRMSYEGETIPSFSMEIYEQYCKRNGIEKIPVKTFSDDLFAFTYSGKSGSYEVLSMCDILEGSIDQRTLKDSIVLIGAYAPGMQDAYHAAVQRGAQMYGVEIHANILEALMEGKTAVFVNQFFYGFIGALLVLLYYACCKKMKIIPSTVLLFVLMGAALFLGKFLYAKGYVTDVAELLLFFLIVYAFWLVKGYLSEIWRRKKVLSAFKKYVAPQVVDEIARQGEFHIALGGENRHIAVLFVDIRGFTPMSESLEPEQVVEILNEYLELTTNSIFKNGGTLDKFIGDATMAVFNAPFDLEDYIFKAVCTARDIAAGSEALEKRLMERFGKSVSFGIGVNCGNAVVGNIGCDFRMDYTAIGDTVNTAARLESNAKRGQILISKDVYDAVKDRIEAEEVGVIPLKGKSNGVFVYDLKNIL